MEPLLQQLQFQIDKIKEHIIARDKAIGENLQQIISQQSLTAQISQIEAYKEFLDRMYQNATSYTNLVILGGYAGLFGIWQLMKEKLDALTTLGIAALLVFSVIIFIFWEVYKMITFAILSRKLSKIIDRDFEPENRLQAWQLALNNHSKQEARLWPFFLIPTVLTGFGAGIWALSTFLKTLLSIL